MKRLLILVSIISIISVSANAQTLFKPLPKPSFSSGFTVAQNNYGISLDSIIKSIRPVAVITGVTSTGEQLAGGAGLGYQKNVWDASSQSYITQYSISIVGLLGTNGNKITGTAGLVVGIPGTNGLAGVGGGYDLTLGQWVLITGIQIKFN